MEAEKVAEAGNAAEATANARQMFENADKNNNGFLTKSEIRKYFKEHPAEKNSILGSEFRWKEFFTNMDEDGDAQFDVNEWTKAAGAAAYARQVFQNADKNKNGSLTKSEIRKYFKKHPAEKNSILGSDFRWNEFFTNMDKDGDAQFDVHEWMHAVIRASKSAGTKKEEAAEPNAVATDDTGSPDPKAVTADTASKGDCGSSSSSSSDSEASAEEPQPSPQLEDEIRQLKEQIEQLKISAAEAIEAKTNAEQEMGLARQEAEAAKQDAESANKAKANAEQERDAAQQEAESANQAKAHAEQQAAEAQVALQRLSSRIHGYVHGYYPGLN